MKRLYVELKTQVGKPLLIQRYEYHFTDDDDYLSVVKRIREEHGYHVPISCGQARLLEVVYIKELTSPAVPEIAEEVGSDENYEEEENYDISKKNRRSRKRRI